MTKSAKNGPGAAFQAQAGKGRPKGVPNKNTTAVKEMILAALDQAGGAAYLAEQAEKNPPAFMTLVGKVLPMQVTGADGGPIRHEVDVSGLSEATLRELAGVKVGGEG